LVDRKPVSVRRAEWRVLTLPPNGKHDRNDALRSVIDAVDLGFRSPRSPDGVLDGRGRFYERRSRWTPSAPLNAAILAASLRRIAVTERQNRG
jgi:hypothetical protein